MYILILHITLFYYLWTRVKISSGWDRSKTETILVKDYLQSTISQERFSSSALLSLEN